MAEGEEVVTTGVGEAKGGHLMEGEGEEVAPS